MSHPLPSQQYAYLASDSYDKNRNPGVRDPSDRETVVLGGITYKVYEQYDNPKTGYQGTVYQRTDTGQFVVAHRGTEFDREWKQDGLVADGGMVLGRTNAQIPEAMALTERALGYAKKYGDAVGVSAPDVSVTGHSLGGTLAQVTAAKLNLYGEAFNPYGAHSLNQKIPEGGHKFTNHVMAGDVVSAASGHFGQVRTYARSDEVATLLATGFGSLNPMPNRTVAAAVATGVNGSHNMDNFMPMDSKGRPDISVLSDPQATERAARYSGTIQEYRNEVRMMRGGITTVADIMNKVVESHIKTGEFIKEKAEGVKDKAEKFFKDAGERLFERSSSSLDRPVQGGSVNDMFNKLHANLTSGDSAVASRGLADVANSSLGRDFHAKVTEKVDQQEIAIAAQQAEQQTTQLLAKQQTHEAQQQAERHVRSV